MNWISVKELLPGQCWKWQKVGYSEQGQCSLNHEGACYEGASVLIKGISDKIHIWGIAKYRSNKWWILFGDLSIENITHWMVVKVRID